MSQVHVQIFSKAGEWVANVDVAAGANAAATAKAAMKKAGKSFKFNNAFLRDGAWDVKVNGSKVTQLFMVHGA